MTVTGSLYRARFTEPTKSTSSEDPTPRPRPVSLRSPECPLLFPACYKLTRILGCCPGSAGGAAHNQRSINLESETHVSPRLGCVTWSKLLLCAEPGFPSAELAQGCMRSDHVQSARQVIIRARCPPPSLPPARPTRLRVPTSVAGQELSATSSPVPHHGHLQRAGGLNRPL